MQSSGEKIWAAAQAQLRSMLSGDTYNLWFAPLRAGGQDNSSLTLEVANDFCEVWLKENYLSLLQDVVALASGRQLQIRFKVGLAQNGEEVLEIPRTAAVKSRHAEGAEKAAAGHETGFNPKNTFDTFVVGNNNNFAYAAA